LPRLKKKKNRQCQTREWVAWVVCTNILQPDEEAVS
jgi:hypothetical protein